MASNCLRVGEEERRRRGRKGGSQLSSAFVPLEGGLGGRGQRQHSCARPEAGGLGRPRPDDGGRGRRPNTFLLFIF